MTDYYDDNSNAKVFRSKDAIVVRDEGIIVVESGGVINLETGAQIQINGVDKTSNLNSGGGGGGGGAVDSVNGETGDVVLTTTDIAEGSNQYFTNERAQDAVGAALTDTATIDLTYNDAAGTISGDIKAGSVTAEMLANSYQPLDSDLTAIAALTTTSYGRGFLALADAGAARTALALGTLATQNGTFSGTSSGTNTGDQDLSGYQPLDSDLTAIAALTTTSYGRAFLALADAAAARTALSLGTLATQNGTFSGTSSGTNTGDQDLSGYQPLDSDLTAIAALTTTSYGRAFLALADAAAGRTALGLGSLATQSGTFSGTSSGTNTGDQDLSGKQAVLSGASLTAVTVAGTDKVLIQDSSDSDNLKTVTAQSIADLASGGGSSNCYAATGGGSVNAHTATVAGVSSLTDGLVIVLTPSGTNTSSSTTFNLNSLGAYSILRPDGTQVHPGDISTYQPALLIYNANYASWKLINPYQVQPEITSISGNTWMVSNYTYEISTGSTLHVPGGGGGQKNDKIRIYITSTSTPTITGDSSVTIRFLNNTGTGNLTYTGAGNSSGHFLELTCIGYQSWIVTDYSGSASDWTLT